MESRREISAAESLVEAGSRYASSNQATGARGAPSLNKIIPYWIYPFVPYASIERHRSEKRATATDKGRKEGSRFFFAAAAAALKQNEKERKNRQTGQGEEEYLLAGAALIPSIACSSCSLEERKSESRPTGSG